jgi:hypothetical protein
MCVVSFVIAKRLRLGAYTKLPNICSFKQTISDFKNMVQVNEKLII